MYMKYLLINPPIFDIRVFLGSSQPTHLLRISAYLKSQGHSVHFFDFDPIRLTGADDPWDLSSAVTSSPQPTNIHKTYGNTNSSAILTRLGKSNEEFKQFLTTIDKPDKIFITSLMTFHCRGVYEAVALCKEIYPDVEVTVGGVYASLCPEHAKRSKADKVFVGEIPEANAIKPDVGLLEFVPDYIIVKSRWGCPSRCSYCAVPKLEGGKLRSLSPELVFQHMKEIHHDFGIKRFNFWDSNILIGWKEHLGPILDMVRKSGLDIDIDLSYGFQPSLLTNELSLKMKESGVLDYFFLPIESADDQLYMTRFHRTSTVADLKRAVDMLRGVGYTKFGFYVLAGMPEQSLESVLRSCALAWELGGFPLLLFFTPIPGTEEYEKHKGLIKGKDLEDLSPRLYPFCKDEGQLNEYFSLLDYNLKSLDQAKEYSQSLLHVKMHKLLRQQNINI